MSEEDMNRCKYCRQEIMAEARKCHFCGSFQGIRGKIFTWGSLISILLALLSILALIIPPAIEAIKGDYSKVSATFIAADFGNYELLLTNTGNRPAVLMSITINYKESGSDKYDVIATVPLGEGNKEVVEAGDSIFVRYNEGDYLPAHIDLIGRDNDLDVTDCLLSIHYSQFEGSLASEKLEYQCFYIPSDVWKVILEAKQNSEVMPGVIYVSRGNNREYMNITKQTIEWARKHGSYRGP